MKNNLYVILVVMFFTSLPAFAQTSLLDTPRNFVSYQNIDLYSDLVLPDTFQISLTATTLTLATGTRMRELPIEHVQGVWTAYAEEGELTFDILVANTTGKGTFKREAGVLSLCVDLSQRVHGMKQRFVLINP